MSILINISIGIFFLALCGLALGFFTVVLKTGREKWNEAASLSESAVKVLTGEVAVDRDGAPDPRTVKGKVWSNKQGRWIEQGQLSDEYVKHMAS